MIIYCKIGTLSGERLKACGSKGRSLRKTPEIGQIIWVRNLESGTKPERVRIVGVKDVGEVLYYCDRF